MIGIILLGAPGSGKGVLANFLKNKYNLEYISTGSIFRNISNSNNEFSFLIKKYIDNGKLVPDEITIKILEDNILKNNCANGYIIDGFPRTIVQAQAFENMIKKNNLKIDFIINISIDSNLLINRIINRRICNKCNISYNILTMPPKKDNVCDICNEKLIQRSDDVKEVFNKRLKNYYRYADSLIEFYKKSSYLFINLDGSMGNKNFDFISKIIDNCN